MVNKLDKILATTICFISEKREKMGIILSRPLVAVCGLLAAASLAEACSFDQVTLEARKADPSWEGSYFSTDVPEPQWLETIFNVAAYGEKLEYRYIGGQRHVVGHVVARIESTGLVAYVATAKFVGSPYAVEVSWREGDTDSVEDVRWLTGDDVPPLTDEPAWERTYVGERMEIGDVVFSIIQGGPFQGMDLAFAGCRE